MQKSYDLEAQKNATHPNSNEAEKWAEENQSAIKEYNDFIEESGVFSDEHRCF